MQYTVTSEQKQQYHDEGYFIVRGLIPPAEIEALKAGVEELMDDSLSGKGPDIPWINKEKRIPERLGLMLRPGWSRPAFLDSLERGPFLPIAEQILESPVRYSLFGMLAGGDGRPYVQAWHRDLAPIEGPEELPVLERNYKYYTQTNAPLLPDRFLTIVPGSHLRPATEEERAILKGDGAAGDLPGQLTVEMGPGDVAFYYSNLLHRGFNPKGEMRWTMHHAFVRADVPVHLHESRQEEWIASEGFLDSLPEKLRPYFQRYLDAVPAGEPAAMNQLN